MIETAPPPNPSGFSPIHRARVLAVLGCRNWPRLAIPQGAIVLAAGCASKEFSYNTKVAGGETMRFTIVAGRPEPAEEDGIKIMEAGLRPDPDGKNVIYGFQFSDSSANRALQSVRVEDVSEDTPTLLLEDLQPKLVAKHWASTTRTFEADDPALRWLFYVNDSVRVYRFTITMADGRKVVLHQAAMVPGWLKMTIRHMFGEKY